MTACIAHVSGPTATMAGVGNDGRPFVVDIPLRGVIALSKGCADALLSMTRPEPPATTDQPLPDLVGREGE